MNNKALRGVAFGKVILALLVLVGITVAEIVGFLVVFFLNISDESLWSIIIPELAGALAAVVGVVLLGGGSQVSTSRKDITYTFRFGWWCMAVGLALMVLEVVDYTYQGTPISEDWLARTAECALLCLGIGVLEEFMFHGVIYNGLLAVMGDTHLGVVSAIMITSLLFGMAHIDFSSDFSDILSATQAVLKIVQTGMYSVMLCVILLRTRKLGGISLFHGFDDFIILAPGVALYNEMVETDYVTTGEDAIYSVYFYLIIIALYAPFLIKALRELHRGHDVYPGAFMERTIAQVKAREEAAAQAQALSAQQAVMQFGPQPPTGAVPAMMAGVPTTVAPAPSSVPVLPATSVRYEGASRLPPQEPASEFRPPLSQEPIVSGSVPVPSTPHAPQVDSARQALPTSSTQPRHLAPRGTAPARRYGHRPPAPKGWKAGA